MRQYTIEFETNSLSTTEAQTWTQTGANMTVQSSIVYAGSFAAKSNPAAGAGGNYFEVNYSSDHSQYLQARFRVDTLPSANSSIMMLLSGGVALCYIDIRNDGSFIVKYSDALGGQTQLGSASSTIATGGWHTLELHIDDHLGVSLVSIEGRLDGVSFASGTVALAAGSAVPNGVIVIGDGEFDSTASGVWYWDNVYLNDTIGDWETAYPTDNTTNILPIRYYTGNIAGASSGNLTLHCAAGDLVVIGWAAFDPTLANRTASTVTVGGAGATLVANSKSNNNTSQGQSQLATFLTPTAVSKTITLTFGGSVTNADWYVILLRNTNQSSQPNTSNNGISATTSDTVTVTTSANNCLLLDAMNGNIGPMSPGTGQISIMDRSGSTGRGSYKTTGASGSQSMSYTTGSNDDYALGVIAVGPVVIATSSLVGFRALLGVGV